MADREGRLDTKVAIVTGGSTGIGEAIVHRFAREGARVVFCARSEDAGSAVERAVRSDPIASGTGGDATFVQCDVTDEAAVAALVQRTVDFYGRIDIIVANAGTGGGQLWPDEPTDVWDGFVKLNLNGMMFLCRAAWPHLVASGGGFGHRNHLAVRVDGHRSRSVGQDGRRRLRRRIKRRRPRWKGSSSTSPVAAASTMCASNAIRPGRILTDKFRSWLGEDGIFWNHYKEVQLIKRHGSADDIANAALFLASDESSFITGTVLDVNGGAVVKI